MIYRKYKTAKSLDTEIASFCHNCNIDPADNSVLLGNVPEQIISRNTTYLYTGCTDIILVIGIANPMDLALASNLLLAEFIDVLMRVKIRAHLI
jgi:hypothetical protein